MTRQKSLAINVLAAAATLACIGTASAQTNETYNPNAYILLNGSAVKPDSKYPEDKTGWGGGLKYGIPLNPSWDLQIGGNYATSTDHGGNFHQTLAGVDALYLFTPAGFRPFVLVGVGAARDHFGDGVNGVAKKHRLPTPTSASASSTRSPRRWACRPTSAKWAPSTASASTPYDIKHAANTYANVGLTWAFGAPPTARRSRRDHDHRNERPPSPRRRRPRRSCAAARRRRRPR